MDRKGVVVPHDVPVLKERSVPTVFPNLPVKYATKILPKKRKRNVGQCSSVPAKESRKDIDNSAREWLSPRQTNWTRMRKYLRSTQSLVFNHHQNTRPSRRSNENGKCCETAEYLNNKVR
ncbi:hypothetical protein HPB48_023612 [Haemaphysalis longicornis]|uniref:Uncharacterized protein n=1 Tax=Haemaphysalis longicornis TaxID=44386 RepID=A0A9J6GWW5_HAELO|nr:hypothetical protein HPB48_023612 [Haemaphysalis longicornis]